MRKSIRVIALLSAIILLFGCAGGADKQPTTTESAESVTTTAAQTVSTNETVATTAATPISTTATKANTTKARTEAAKPSTAKVAKPTASNSTTVRTAVTSATKPPINREPNTFSDYNNEKSYDNLITKTYDESDIVAKYIMEECWDPSISQRITFGMINSQYPAECIRKSGDNVYAVYKTKQGGLFYIFFDESMAVKHCAYSEKRLSYADFAQVKAGQSVADIEKIDPAVATLKKYWYPDLEYAATTHILTDGVLRIFYRKSAQTEEFTVWKTSYSKNFIFDYKTVFEDNPTGAKLDYRILSTDYVS